MTSFETGISTLSIDEAKIILGDEFNFIEFSKGFVEGISKVRLALESSKENSDYKAVTYLTKHLNYLINYLAKINKEYGSLSSDSPLDDWRTK